MTNWHRRRDASADHQWCFGDRSLEDSGFAGAQQIPAAGKVQLDIANKSDQYGVEFELSRIQTDFSHIAGRNVEYLSRDHSL